MVVAVPRAAICQHGIPVIPQPGARIKRGQTSTAACIRLVAIARQHGSNPPGVNSLAIAGLAARRESCDHMI